MAKKYKQEENHKAIAIIFAVIGVVLLGAFLLNGTLDIFPLLSYFLQFAAVYISPFVFLVSIIYLLFMNDSSGLRIFLTWIISCVVYFVIALLPFIYIVATWSGEGNLLGLIFIIPIMQSIAVAFVSGLFAIYLGVRK